jgi:signal transduction histidine kinase
VALAEIRTPQSSTHAVVFLAAYLGFCCLVLALEHFLEAREWHLPLIGDLAALAVLLVMSPSSVAIWFPYLFVAYVAGSRWGFGGGVVLSGIVSLALLARTFELGELQWAHLLPRLGLAAGTMAAGAGLALIGHRSRRHAAANEFLTRLADTLQVEQGMAESLRLMLDELTQEFGCERAILVYRDSELERVFVWRVKAGESERIAPENLPLTRAECYLLEDLDATVAWNNLGGSAEGFGWDRRNRRPFGPPPDPPPASKVEDKPWRSFMAAAFDQQGQAVGRLFVLDGLRRFTRRDLERFERIARYIGPPLENLFLLRHIRARAIEAERSRISRDLHDGILQTLLSVEMQLDVMRRRLPAAVEQVASGMASLQQTVRNESAELRRMVTDLRPLRVQSADLMDLMRGFAERFCNDSDLGVDLLIDSAELRAPDRVCRELFQIYREALNNIKKHAKASHVVVKLSQDESRIVLVVDDNGEGFSFAGRFTGDELDRLRLGPISIKERTRTVGGVLTVESSPGHGARLTVEIPLG